MAYTAPAPKPQAGQLARFLDRFLAVPMFWSALVFLAVAAGVIHRIGHGHYTLVESEMIAWGLVGMWPIFVAEAALRFWATAHDRSFRLRLGAFLGVFLLPPIRLGFRSCVDRERIWLPGLGWRPVDKDLRRHLEKIFSVPMIVMALLVLPVLALEYFWEDQVRSHPAMSLGLDLASSLIWMAFAVDFFLLIGVADNKIRYCIQNWIDLAVVALPVLEFLPVLRLWQAARLLRLNQLGKMSRLYRLRGLLMKAWRAVLVLEMIHRLLGNHKERRLRKLKDLLAARLEEIEDLEKEIDELEEALKPKTAPALPAEPEPKSSWSEQVLEQATENVRG